MDLNRIQQKPPQRTDGSEDKESLDDVSKKHKTTLEEFEKRLRDAVQCILGKRTKYDRVVAIIMY